MDMQVMGQFKLVSNVDYEKTARYEVASATAMVVSSKWYIRIYHWLFPKKAHKVVIKQFGHSSAILRQMSKGDSVDILSTIIYHTGTPTYLAIERIAACVRR